MKVGVISRITGDCCSFAEQVSRLQNRLPMPTNRSSARACRDCHTPAGTVADTTAARAAPNLFRIDIRSVN
jgi:hypothetical protein